jgi:hypothetical protein
MPVSPSILSFQYASGEDGWFGRSLSPFTPVAARLTHASLSARLSPFTPVAARTTESARLSHVSLSASVEYSNLGGAARWESLLLDNHSGSPVLPSAWHSNILAQSGAQGQPKEKDGRQQIHGMQANDHLPEELTHCRKANAVLGAQEMGQSLDTLQARLGDNGIERERAKAYGKCMETRLCAFLMCEYAVPYRQVL